MTEKTIKIITCDGPLCIVDCRDGIIPVGWITFTGVTGDRHLCSVHATKAGIARQLYYRDMERISKERGD